MFHAPVKTKRELLGNVVAQPVKSKLVARNTMQYTDENNVTRILLHNTNILTLHPNGAFEINTGGYNTVTTRERMNRFLPAGYSVFTKSAVLHLSTPKQTFTVLERASVGPRGGVTTDMTQKQTDNRVKLLNAFMKAWRAQGLPSVDESKGDPWVLSHDRVTRDTAEDWIESKYVFRKFYQFALSHAGVPDDGLGIHLHFADMRGMDQLAYGRIRRYARYCLSLAS